MKQEKVVLFYFCPSTLSIRRLELNFLLMKQKNNKLHCFISMANSLISYAIDSFSVWWNKKKMCCFVSVPHLLNSYTLDQFLVYETRKSYIVIHSLNSYTIDRYEFMKREKWYCFFNRPLSIRRLYLNFQFIKQENFAAFYFCRWSPVSCTIDQFSIDKKEKSCTLCWQFHSSYTLNQFSFYETRKSCTFFLFLSSVS